MLGSRVSGLVEARVLADGRSLFGRRPEETGGSESAAERDHLMVLAIHGPVTHAKSVRQRVMLGRGILFLFLADCLLMGYNYWTQPTSALHTAAFALALLAAAVGAFAVVRRYLVVLVAVQCTYAVQFIIGLMLISSAVQVARLVVIAGLYVALETYRRQIGHRWFIPFM